MKRRNTLILMIWFTTLSFGQDSIQTDKSRIKELIIKSFDDIWSELNSKNIEKYHTKDFLLLENGEIWNNDSIANYLDNAILKKPIPKRMNSIEFIEIKVFKEMAWIAYKNHAVFLIENKIIRKPKWLESATAVLTENGWRLEMLHSTEMISE